MVGGSVPDLVGHAWCPVLEPGGGLGEGVGAKGSSDAAARARSPLVNGLPGIVAWCQECALLSVVAFIVAEGRISGIAVVTDPAEPALMDLPTLVRSPSAGGAGEGAAV